jgi:hypothetical protein
MLALALKQAKIWLFWLTIWYWMVACFEKLKNCNCSHDFALIYFKIYLNTNDWSNNIDAHSEADVFTSGNWASNMWA